MKKKLNEKTVLNALVLVVITLAVVVNAVAMLAVNRFPLKLDLTDSKLYQLSPASYRMAKELTTPVNITVFSAEQDFPAMLREILAGYGKLDGSITVSYKDPFGNPKLVDSFLQRGTRILQNDIIVESGGKFKRHTIEDLYLFDNGKTKVTGVRAEQQLTGAIIQLGSNRMPRVRFTDGHNENPSKGLMELFSKNNYQTERIALAISPLGSGIDLVVIAAPTRDFAVQETVVLEEYLDQGGSLMVFLAPSATPLPNLEGFLERWGISYGSGVVLEPQAHISDNLVNIVPRYGQHEINVYFGDKRFFLLMPSARVLTATEKPSFDLDVMTVLLSTPDAYAKGENDLGSQAKKASDPQGPFSLALTASKPVSGKPSPIVGSGSAGSPSNASGSGKVVPDSGVTKKQARIFAAGSAMIYADDILGMSTFANTDFLTQTINWLNPDQTAVTIPAKTIAPDPLTILPGEAAVAGIVLIGIVPLLILATGILVAVRRRRA